MPRENVNPSSNGMDLKLEQKEIMKLRFWFFKFGLSSRIMNGVHVPKPSKMKIK
jgi:hypothetical protein